jgi:hypothetical protein
MIPPRKTVNPMSRRYRHNQTPAFRAKVALVALRVGKYGDCAFYLGLIQFNERIPRP